MGRRIVFYQSTLQISLPEHLRRDFVNFRSWIIENHNEESKRENTILSDITYSFLDTNSEYSNLKDTTREICDEIVYQYLLSYCDHGPGKVNFEIVGPMVYAYHYEDLEKEIQSVIKSTEFLKLWSILIHGRSYFGDQPFTKNSSIESVLGYWNKGDQIKLEATLNHYGKRLTTLSKAGLSHLLSLLNCTDLQSDIIIDRELV